MADLLRTASDWLQAIRATHLSSPVEYRRGEQVLAVNATVGRTEYEIADDAGSTIQAEVKDFLVRAADLPFEPLPGDRIVLDGRTYEVMAFTGQGCWRYSDPFGRTCRIHTREVG